MDPIVKRLMENKKISMEINDQDHNIEDLIKYIATLAQSGHSFNVVVDPKSDSEKVFWIDGDGSDRINDIKLEEDEDLKESIKIDSTKLESDIRDKVKEIMTSPEFGFEDDYDEYSTVEVYDKDEYYEIEVRAEVSYEGMMDIANALNPIVEKYDKDAYFDIVTSGIMSAYIMK